MLAGISVAHREGGKQVTDECIVADTRGAVVFDPARTPDLERCWFDPGYWRRRDALRTLGGGRGGVAIIDTPAGAGVLRHYRRGGSVARLLRDRYLWTGRQRTRSMIEYRLLDRLHAEGFAVPRPIGAAWTRHGPYYSADLITGYIQHAAPLSAGLAELCAKPEMAAAIGACIGRFHARGVFHADLNAHNILIGDDGMVSLIDFDRGRLMPPQASWQQANLRRLHRSMIKLGAAGGDLPGWHARWWQPLLDAHARALARP